MRSSPYQAFFYLYLTGKATIILKSESSTLYLFLFILLSIQSCKKDQDPPAPPPPSLTEPKLPDSPFDYGRSAYSQHLLDALIQHDNTPPHNQITNHGATLGRVLFYDKSLSFNNLTACASCHHQERAFTDGLKVSEGFNGQFTRRNSMSLINLRMYDRQKMFWDERSPNLEDQVLHPIQDSIEMGLSLAELVPKLEERKYYAQLFQNAFGTEDISIEKISKALSQFLRSIVSYNSKYDMVLEGSANFSPSEARGQLLYNTVGSQQGCVSCHGGDLIDQSSYDFQIGQTPSFVGPHDLSDLGIFEASGDPADSSRFKVSSLRNIALTAPYLHDGSIADLNELFSSTSPHNFGMSNSEVEDLIDFLETLTDNQITSDEKFSSPFEN